jgi:hypothetical protein
MTNIEKDELQRLKDTVRVKETLAAIEAYWLNHPYLRLGQLIYNIWRNRKKCGSDLFYMPDSCIIAELTEEKSTVDEPTSQRITQD